MENENNISDLVEEVNEYIINMPSVIKKLNVDQNLIDLINQKVSLLLKKTYDGGNDITKDVINLCENDISFLIEMEHCYKSKERIIEKVYNSVNNDKLDLDKAIEKVEDALRFTYIIMNNDKYLDKVQEYLNKLEKQGYKVYDFLNYWGNEFYQGINVLLEYNGIRFEIQFHTINSYDIKEGYTRKPYIVARNSFASQKMIEKANIIRKYYQQKVKVPTDAIGYQYKK